MVDIHAHILAGIDDGPTDIKESIAMCEMAYKDGIRTIVATPHIGKFPNTKESVILKVQQLQEELNSRKLGISLLPGADVEFSTDIFSLIEENKALTLNCSRYLLLDTPPFLMPPNIERHISLLIEKGVVPIITHPERCMQAQEDLGILYDIIKAGALIQVTAASITGGFGRKAKKAVDLILKSDLAHIIATDAHGIHNRPARMAEAVDAAANITNNALVINMVTIVPQAIIEDKPVEIPKPKKPR